MDLLYLLVAAAGQPSSAKATATVRIVRSARSSQREWQQTPASRRSERVIRDEKGHKIIVKLIEYE